MRSKIILGQVLGTLVAIMPPASQAWATQEPASLRIVVLHGDNVRHDTSKRRRIDLAVRVEDSQGDPVSGAEVVFTLPEGGPGGSFNKAASSLSVTTDEKGHAAAKNFKPNKVPGKYQIRVQATTAGRVATATLAQTNLRGKRGNAVVGVFVVTLGAVALIASLLAL